MELDLECKVVYDSTQWRKDFLHLPDSFWKHHFDTPYPQFDPSSTIVAGFFKTPATCEFEAPKIFVEDCRFQPVRLIALAYPLMALAPSQEPRRAGDFSMTTLYQHQDGRWFAPEAIVAYDNNGTQPIHVPFAYQIRKLCSVQEAQVLLEENKTFFSKITARIADLESLKQEIEPYLSKV